MTAEDESSLPARPMAWLSAASGRHRVIVAAVAGLLVIVLGVVGCVAIGGSGGRGANASVAPFVPIAPSSTAPSPSDSPSPSPTPSPTPSASPSAARPSPTPARTSNRPAAPTTSPARGPQTQATGHGPAGSRSVTGNMTVALTFDDGPDPVYTPPMLALLRQYRVKATFCLIGSRARDYPDIVRQIVADGHTLCNHSWQHLLDLGKRDAAYRLKDLTDTNAAIQAAVPGAVVKYFRAPGGNFTTDLVSQAASLGMASIYWNVDPRDWDSATYGTGTSMVNHIVSAVEGNVRPGSIILSHDRAHPDTYTAYRTLLPWLLDRYTLVAL